MKISAAGIAALEAREGKRMLAYRDCVGVLTIGVGHTGRAAPPRVTAGMRIGQAECDAFLAADLAPLEAALAGALKVPVSQNEWDALCSLGFNIGAGGETHSTVLKRLNLGDVAGAADAFRMWEKPASLAPRREAERTQFLKPDGPTTRAPLAITRADALDKRAAGASGTARAAKVGAAVTAAAGGGATAVAAASAHPGIALAAGGLAGLAAVVQAAAAWWHARHAATLANNAAAQRIAAAQPSAAA